MSHYYREHSSHKQTRFLRRYRVFMVICVLLILMGGGFLMVDSFLLNRKASAPSNPTAETKAAVASSIDVFKTQHFQFQASKNWIFVANESTPTKFVYRYLKNNLVQHDLKIYVNDAGPKPSASYLMLVKQTEASLQVLQVSENCKTLALPKDARIQPVKFEGAAFSCNPDTAEYSVALSIAGQEASNLQLKRPDGSLASYSLVYRNLTADPHPRLLYDIAGSFQVR